MGKRLPELGIYTEETQERHYLPAPRLCQALEWQSDTCRRYTAQGLPHISYRGHNYYNLADVQAWLSGSFVAQEGHTASLSVARKVDRRDSSWLREYHRCE